MLKNENRDLPIFSFRLDPQTIEKDFIKEYAKMADPSDGHVTLSNFSSFLHLPETQHLVVELFRLYDVVRAELRSHNFAFQVNYYNMCALKHLFVF